MLKPIYIFMCLFLTSVQVHAGSTGAGDLSTPHFMGNGVIIISHDGQRNDPPGCATFPGRWAFNGTTDAGKTQLTGLLTAYTTGKQFVIIGTGTCNIWGDTESLNYFYVVN